MKKKYLKKFKMVSNLIEWAHTLESVQFKNHICSVWIFSSVQSRSAVWAQGRDFFNACSPSNYRRTWTPFIIQTISNWIFVFARIGLGGKRAYRDAPGADLSVPCAPEGLITQAMADAFTVIIKCDFSFLGSVLILI